MKYPAFKSASAVIACLISGAAIAQGGPTLAETKKFIADSFPLCEPYFDGQVNDSIDIQGSRVQIQNLQDGWRQRGKYSRHVSTVDLRKVRVELSRNDGRIIGVQFFCEEVGCSTQELSNQRDGNVLIGCAGDRGERLFKAFKHLQSFTGGPKKPLF